MRVFLLLLLATSLCIRPDSVGPQATPPNPGWQITDAGIRQGEGVLPAPWTKLTLKGISPARRTVVLER